MTIDDQIWEAVMSVVRDRDAEILDEQTDSLKARFPAHDREDLHFYMLGVNLENLRNQADVLMAVADAAKRVDDAVRSYRSRLAANLTSPMQARLMEWRKQRRASWNEFDTEQRRRLEQAGVRLPDDVITRVLPIGSIVEKRSVAFSNDPSFIPL